jgi:hypothetical protein
MAAAVAAEKISLQSLHLGRVLSLNGTGFHW